MKLDKIYIITCLLFILVGSCKEFVEVDPPISQMATESVFANDQTAFAAMSGLYSDLIGSGQSLPYRLSLYTGLGGDELTDQSGSTGNLEAYTNSFRAVDASTNNTWTALYNYIYQANAIYEGCNRSNNMTDQVKSQLMAEALFIRSFCYFYLVNLWGPVPLVLSTNYQQYANASRSPVNVVYTQIISDLEAALDGLAVDYVGADSKTTSNERVRPNKFAAYALLARIYLYMQNYPDAEDMASMVIDHTVLYDTMPVNQIFLSTSKEAIWQLAAVTPRYNNINTWEGYYYTLTNIPSTGGYQNSSTVSQSLLDAFESGDKRKTNWIGQFTSGTGEAAVNYLYPNKYKVSQAATVTEHTEVLRLAEQYLIRSEARAIQGNSDGAIADLDIIRERAGLPLVRDTKPGISQRDLLNTIYHERQVELFTEWCHRWFDLKRTELIDDVMPEVSISKETIWKSDMQIWPIPQKEIETDGNLVQNPGYN